jgi:hypothetical protein
MSRQFSAVDKPFSYVIRGENPRDTSEFLHIEHILLDKLVKVMGSINVQWSC